MYILFRRSLELDSTYGLISLEFRIFQSQNRSQTLTELRVVNGKISEHKSTFSRTRKTSILQVLLILLNYLPREYTTK